MWDGFVGKQIRKGNRTLLWVNLVLAGLFLLAPLAGGPQELARSYGLHPYFGLVGCLPIFALFGWNIKKAIERGANPGLHPSAKTLAKYGPLHDVIASIEHEVVATNQAVKIGPVQISPSWLLLPDSWGLDALPLTYIVWQYKLTTRHSTNGIPTGKTHAAVIWDRFGKSRQINTSEKGTLAILQEVFQRAPWILFGFDKEIEKQWKSNAAVIVAAVDQRRQELLNRQRQAVRA